MKPNVPPADPRIYLAAERTLLAWVRTGVALMGFGLVVTKLRFFLDEMMLMRGTPTPISSGLSVWSGLLLMALGVFVIVASAIRHQFYLRALERLGSEAPVPRRFPLVIAGVLAAVGVALAVRLAITANQVAPSPSSAPRDRPAAASPP